MKIRIFGALSILCVCVLGGGGGVQQNLQRLPTNIESDACGIV